MNRSTSISKERYFFAKISESERALAAAQSIPEIRKIISVAAAVRAMRCEAVRRLGGTLP